MPQKEAWDRLKIKSSRELERGLEEDSRKGDILQSPTVTVPVTRAGSSQECITANTKAGPCLSNFRFPEAYLPQA